ncbi:unnamed protein product [Clavelina lepadiformis]|uniref:Uncharacterized protein n=1 Tax=Clavelina lepadiformis TaxID=159417 RepID=A0ABP0G8Q5_CLALP
MTASCQLCARVKPRYYKPRRTPVFFLNKQEIAYHYRLRSELRSFFHNKDISTSRTFIYNPQGNEEEVDLIEANPDHVFVRFLDGRQATVPIRDLAPVGEEIVKATTGQDLESNKGNTSTNTRPPQVHIDRSDTANEKLNNVSHERDFGTPADTFIETNQPRPQPTTNSIPQYRADDNSQLRRSSRIRRPQERLNYETF